MIQNDNEQATPRRGSSPAPEKREQELENWGEPKDSPQVSGNQTDDERWQDDGGESGEAV